MRPDGAAKTAISRIPRTRPRGEDTGARPEIVSRLMSVEQVAEVLSCTPAAVRKWIYQRRLPVVKIGRLTRIRRADVGAIVANGLPATDDLRGAPRRAA
jgi:excisionase family DNA binding protein